MLGYRSALSQASFLGHIELLMCFSGALEKDRLHNWVKRQVNDRQPARQILSHIQNKGTPPPKVWFLPPVCVAHYIGLALLRVGIGVSEGQARGCLLDGTTLGLPAHIRRLRLAC